MSGFFSILNPFKLLRGRRTTTADIDPPAEADDTITTTWSSTSATLSWASELYPEEEDDLPALTATIDSSGQPLTAGDYVVVPSALEEWGTEDEIDVARFVRLELYPTSFPDMVLQCHDGEYALEITGNTHVWRVEPEDLRSVTMYGVDENEVVVREVTHVKPDTIAKHLLLFGGKTVYTNSYAPPQV